MIRPKVGDKVASTRRGRLGMGVVESLSGKDAAYVAWSSGGLQLCHLGDLLTETEGRLRSAVYRCYNSVGGDVWGEKTPPVGVFVDIMLDQMYGRGIHSGLSEADAAVWDKLSHAAKKRIIRSVGP